MKLGLTFIAALLAKSATPSLAKGTRRVAAEEPAPALAGVAQPDAAAGSKRGLETDTNFETILWDFVTAVADIQTEYDACVTAAAEVTGAKKCPSLAILGVAMSYRAFVYPVVVGWILSGILGNSWLMDGYN
jgi:hypothetical protein